jgi:indole-3-glycerol phosphate synthase/phosphoribosylanthranilate isomerase
VSIQPDAAPATFLARITDATREEVAARKAREPLDTLRARASAASEPRDFAGALRPRRSGPARLIAEIKQASPSKGLLSADFDPVAQAQTYEAGGAAAISVLTEPQFFLGSLEHLAAVRQAVSLPVLRKDFLLDPYQVYEARAAGADATLLILSMLDDALAADLLALIRSLGMEALVEAHDAVEVQRALTLGAGIIGVNARDLRTFEEHPLEALRLRALVSHDIIYVSESGIRDRLGVTRARAWGADAVLVGEALMRSEDPAARVREFATAPGGATAAFFYGEAGPPFVKICGLARPEETQVAMEAGADAVGLVFAPKAKPHRLLTPQRAKAVVAPLPPHGEAPNPIGVFYNASIDEIIATNDTVPLGAFQLTGDETPEECAALAKATGKPVIKTIRLRSEADLALLDNYASVGAIILLDAVTADGYGGSGERSDWALASLAAQRWPVILAGGLTPENVAEAVTTVKPRGVDVSSGVESKGPNGAAKDLAKIIAFVAAARSAPDSQPPTWAREHSQP